ncbi:MAG TPA: DUF1345 domain-containing protein [Casimicrobiaceae bacterium]|nr:DUF1345 domain-containing protein [Casimicrobiaceae bacterium]
MSAARPPPPAAPPGQESAAFGWIDRLGPMRRLLIAFAIGIVAFAVEPEALSPHTRLVTSWDAAALVYLALAWAIIALADAKSTRSHALIQDTSVFIIFLFVLVAACASVVAIALVVAAIKDLSSWPKAWHLALTVVALTSSWVLIQTVFAFHYARRYYRDEKHSAAQEGGLAFPGGTAPDYMDFAYYSFVVGMTSQVSDVQVLSPKMRRLTLAHGVLAFIFNIAVLALSINIIASAI